MVMTRKEYEIIADSVATFINSMANRLENTNAGFNREKFVLAIRNKI